MAQNQLQVLHYPDANFITFQSSGMRRRQKFTFSPPHFFHFSSLTFLSFAGPWVGFISVEKVLGKL